jgi:hypothetical protein
MMQREEIIERVRQRLKEIKGVGETYVLLEEDRDNIKELEKKADEMTLMGLGRGDNRGIKEVLTKDVVIPFTTSMDYVWPCCPNVVLMHHDRVVGEDMDDECKLNELKNCKDNLIIGNIVIYDKDLLRSIDAKNDPLIVVLPPKPCAEVDELPHICNVALASPSPPTDEYLKQKMGLPQSHGTGTFILGFDFECSCGN